VEVKMRKAPRENRILLYTNMIANCKEFWNDSILVIVVSCGNVFYAQRVCELEVKEEYDTQLDFDRFESIFVDAKEEDITHFKAKALEIIGR
jgi:hypothetical protein